MARNRKPAGQPAAERAATAGDVVLASLRRHGIEYFFANPGTDFPPIVEGFARAKAERGRRCRAPCWCRTRTWPSPWRTAPT